MKKKSILLIGLGRFGKHIAMKLNELGHEIMAVDHDEEKVNEIIIPYYNGYVDASASIVSQNTVIDMSGFNGAGGVGFDAGIITATSEYQLNVEQDGAIFYLPYQLSKLTKICYNIYKEINIF